MSRLLLLKSRWSRAGIILLFFVISLSIHFWLYTRLGMITNAILVIPVIVTAWYFGMRGALSMIIVYLGINILLGYMSAPGEWNAYPWEANLTGGTAAILISLLITRMRILAGEQNQEIVARTKAESELQANSSFLSLLNDILRASLEAKDLPTLLDVLVNQSCELFTADTCVITLWDETNQIAFHPAGGYTSHPGPGRIPASHPEQELTSATLEVEHLLVTGDPAPSHPQIEEKILNFPNLSTVVGLPLISGRRKLGALLLGFRHARNISSAERDQGELAARQISLAMVKVILLEEANQHLKELAGLHSIAQTFTPNEDTRQTFGHLTKIVADLIGVRKCLVALEDPSSGEIRGQASGFGLADEQVTAFRYPAVVGMETWDFTEKNIIQVQATKELHGILAEQARKCGLKTMLVASLQNTDKKCIGVLVAANKSDGFGADDIHLLEILAGQVTVVVENTRLLTSERRRATELSTLNKIAVAVAEAHSEDELIEQVTQLIGEQLYPDNFGIMLLDEKKHDLYLHSSYRKGEREPLIRIPLGKGVTGSVARSGKMRNINDVRNEPDYLNVDERILSELCAPLKIGERVIGVINAESARVAAFAIDDESMMGILAGQLAVAIQRLRTADAEYHQTTMLLRSNALIRILAQVGARASAAPDPMGVMKTLGEELSKIGLTCLVALPRDEKQMGISYTSIPMHVIKLFERAGKRPLSEFTFPSDQMLDPSRQDYRPQLIKDPLGFAKKIIGGFSDTALEKLLRPIGIAENVPMCHLPLVSEGKLHGVLWMWGEGLRESDLPTISIFSSQVAIALQNSRLLSEVQRMAVMDEGTGIFNRRHFFDLAEQEFHRARRHNHALTAIIVDIDEFKSFNDRYGHIIGDQVLYQVAQALKNNLRDGDILGRYGGEEFSILLPFTSLETSRQVAERLCKRVAAAGVKSGNVRLSVSVSVGMAELKPETDSLLKLVELADQAMYDAKEAGGNQVNPR